MLKDNKSNEITLKNTLKKEKDNDEITTIGDKGDETEDFKDFIIERIYPNKVLLRFIYIDNNNITQNIDKVINITCEIINDKCIISKNILSSIIENNKFTDDKKKYALYKLLLYYVDLKIDEIILYNERNKIKIDTEITINNANNN